MANESRLDGETGDYNDLPNYMHPSQHSGIMMAHVIFMILAWVFILPVGVVFSIAGHRCALVIRSIFLAVSGLGLVFGIIVNTKTADLYKGNAHHTIGWVATGMVAVHALIDMLLRSTKWPRTNHSKGVGPSFCPSISAVNQSMHSRLPGMNGQISQISCPNSGNGIPHISQYNPGQESETSESDDDYESQDEYKTLVPGRRGFLRKHFIHKYFPRRIPGLALSRLPRMFELSCKVIDWTILVVGYVTLVTGGVTYAGIFRGSNIYNGLAHFIKGGIFFWYGLLTLGRWLGCFSNVGWAWNLKPPCTRAVLTASIPSAEFVESFVIFLYGSTNMFLEHLAGWGGEWTASDLEHVSISIMFFGGGLCGMLVESKTVRHLLNTKIEGMTERVDGNSARSPDLRTLPRTYNSSMNTIPALIILLLGIMMSSHHQSSMISTKIHKQWGMLLAGFAIMRMLTYITMYVSPPASIFPSRPPSELVASFCLVSGGIIFMASTTDIVQWIEADGLMAMFVFTIAMALTAFIMAWETAVLSMKGWAERSKTTKLPNVEEPGYMHVPVS